MGITNKDKYMAFLFIFIIFKKIIGSTISDLFETLGKKSPDVNIPTTISNQNSEKLSLLIADLKSIDESLHQLNDMIIEIQIKFLNTKAMPFIPKKEPHSNFC